MSASLGDVAGARRCARPPLATIDRRQRRRAGRSAARTPPPTRLHARTRQPCARPIPDDAPVIATTARVDRRDGSDRRASTSQIELVLCCPDGSAAVCFADWSRPTRSTRRSWRARRVRRRRRRWRAQAWWRRVSRSTLQEAAPGRPNVIGVLDGREPGPAVMFCGHLDTVGVDGMVTPFEPREAFGRLYGRGAQDMKGGVAAMIAAAGVLASNWRRGRLIVAAVVDEEHMSLGAEALAREWRADMAIVTEPTDLRMAIGHKGFAWMEIVTKGRAAHGSRPEEGRDAIARMGRVLVALEARDRELRARAAGAVSGHRIAARVDHHRRPRAQQLSGSLRAADGAPHRRRRGRARRRGGDRRDPRVVAPRRFRVRSHGAADGLSPGLLHRSRPRARARRSAPRSRTPACRPIPPACRSGPTRPFSARQGFRRCSSVPAARDSTASRNTSPSRMSTRAAMCWSRLSGASCLPRHMKACRS